MVYSNTLSLIPSSKLIILSSAHQQQHRTM